MESELDRVMDGLQALVWTAMPEGRIDFANRRWFEYTGLDPAEEGGSDWRVAVSPEGLPQSLERWRVILTSGEPGELEARLRCCDTRYRWFPVRCSPLRDNAGRIVKWCCVGMDIEDRKCAEEELRNAQAKFAQMDHALAMGQLTASIAHEVNQPLSGVMTNANTCLHMLAVSPPNIADARETARRPIRDGNSASEVVKRFRALFSNKNAALEPVDLNEATREVLAVSWSRLQEAHAVLRTELAEELPLINGDRVQLQQVILNLIENALDAMISALDRPRQMVITTERDEDGCVRLTVLDAGMGFERDSLQRLFDAFYTTKSEGMGIGLSISRSIVERHGRGIWAALNEGIWAALNEGPGAAFSFSVPIVAEDATSPGAMVLVEAARLTERQSK
jgi:PAS domain S-box-containing protein